MKKEKLLQLVEDELSESKETKNWFSETYEVVKEFVVQNYYYIGIVVAAVFVTVGLSYALYIHKAAIGTFFSTYVTTISDTIRNLFVSKDGDKKVEKQENKE